jgi:endonuclease/exonuclease/phosphatase family metal-dependent hydrolase
MRFLSYNIRHGLGLDDVLDLERTARVVMQAQADLVALQEVDRQTGRSGGVDQFARLCELTGYRGTFLQTIPFDGGQYGIAVLSRLPFGAVHRRALPGSEPRGIVAVEVALSAGGSFLFGCTHLDLDARERLASVEVISTWCAELPALPFVLCGDFNSVPDDAILTRMEDHWTLAGSGVSAWGATYPADRPEVRIDHMAYRPESAWRVQGIDVMNEPVASDHRPLVGEMDLVV